MPFSTQVACCFERRLYQSLTCCPVKANSYRIAAPACEMRCAEDGHCALSSADFAQVLHSLHHRAIDPKRQEQRGPSASR